MAGLWVEADATVAHGRWGNWMKVLGVRGWHFSTFISAADTVLDV